MYLGSKTITLPCVALEASHAFDVSPFVFLLSIIVCFSFDGAKVVHFTDVTKFLIGKKQNHKMLIISTL